MKYAMHDALKQTHNNLTNYSMWGYTFIVHDENTHFFLLRTFCCGYIKTPYISMRHVGGRRFSVRELHAASKTSSVNGSHLNVWDFDISAVEFPQQ